MGDSAWVAGGVDSGDDADESGWLLPGKRRPGGRRASTAGRAWYEKAIAILLRGREISLAAEKAWDDAQRAHGKPLRGRSASPNLYFNLGQAYGSLRRYQEALEALRFGRGIDPGQLQFYDPMAAAWAALGKPDQATLIMEEKRVVGGGQSRMCEALADLAAAFEEARMAERASRLNRQAAECGAIR